MACVVSEMKTNTAERFTLGSKAVRGVSPAEGDKNWLGEGGARAWAVPSSPSAATSRTTLTPVMGIGMEGAGRRGESSRYCTLDVRCEPRTRLGFMSC